MDGAITTKILEVGIPLYLLGLLEIQGRRNAIQNRWRKGLGPEIYSGHQMGIILYPERIVPHTMLYHDLCLSSVERARLFLTYQINPS